MEQLSTLDYLRLNKLNKILYKIKCFFCGIPAWFVSLFVGLWQKIKNLGIKIKDNIVDIGLTFKNGSWKTRVSFIIMGFGSVMYGQWLRGIVFFAFEVIFIVYMAVAGGYWLSKFGTLGTKLPASTMDPIFDVPVTILGDNSFKILLYGILTIMFMFALVYTWRLNIKQCKICEEIIASGKKVKSGKEDLHSLIDDQFHKTLLALPLAGIIMFTVLPIIFMILVAFTNYDANHLGNGYSNLFTWSGFDNFNTLFSTNSGTSTFTFGEILGWTLMWALFATFTNYFLGMFVAMMINKKGVYIKKFWRTVLVLTIAIPQFISLIYVSNLFADTGVINATLLKWGWIDKAIPFWTNKHWARAMVIIVNIWIGIPYLMLITTGILMNIPQDLYEQARIDGANVWQQYTKITLPYMLFVTGPYLLTSFTSNINNFNVIYLLTQGGPPNKDLMMQGQLAGDTDLLITWIFNVTTGATANYKMASAIGIMIFLVVAILSLIVYHILPSNRREGDFS